MMNGGSESRSARGISWPNGANTTFPSANARGANVPPRRNLISRELCRFPTARAPTAGRKSCRRIRRTDACRQRRAAKHSLPSLFPDPSSALKAIRCQGVPPFEIAGQRHANDRSDPTSIERVALHDDDGAAIAGSGPLGLPQIGPPDVSLLNHHSTRFSTRRDASAPNSSVSAATASTTSFIARVTGSAA